MSMPPAVDQRFLLDLRGETSALIEAGGNRPFLLCDPKVVWIVYTGAVDVFAVRVEDGRPIGARTHLLRVETGQALFGISERISEEGIGLLAVGTAGTRLLQLTWECFEGLSHDRQYRDEVAVLVDGWLMELSSAIAESVPPKDSLILTPDSPLSLLPGQVSRPRIGILWVTHPQGSSTFMSRADLPTVSGQDFFPLSRHTWLEATTTSEQQAISTEALLEHHHWWSEIEQYHDLVLDCVALQLQAGADVEAERLRQRSDTDRATLERSLNQFISVLHSDAASLGASSDGDLLLRVCRLVGEAKGIEIVSPPRRQGERAGRDPLEEIASASGIRARRITLKDDWWRQDQGPMVGYRAESSEPVALLPVSSRSYALVDPRASGRKIVDRELAETLEPFARVLYRAFPAKPLLARDLLAFGLRGSRRDILVTVATGIVGGALGLVAPLATAHLVDTIIPAGSRGQLLLLTLVLVVTALAVLLFEVSRSIAILRVEGRMGADLQAALWDRLLDLPATFFREYTAGDLASRAFGINLIREALAGATIAAILGVIFSLFSLVLMFYYDVQLALVGLLLVLGLLLFTSAAGYAQLRYQRRVFDLQGRISGRVLQLVMGIAKIRVSGSERRAFSVWASHFTAQKRLAFRARTIANFVSVLNSASPMLITMTIFGVVALGKGTGMEPGTFLGFSAAFAQFLAAVLALSSASIAALTVVPAFERLRPIVFTLPEVGLHKADPGELTGEIELSHVSFRYGPNAPYILRDISLRCRPGEFIAIVGPSGSGKSTLFRLLLGFETPESGTISYDGQDLSSIDVHAVRRQIGVVLQQGRLIQGDIYTNIVGAYHLPLSNVWDAARMAGMEEDINQMPMGMHTVVTEGGATFSGGQRQRLMIARAIVGRPRILLMDEATSALDGNTQETVGGSLRELQATRIVIAHRLSTIMDADRIFVLQSGGIVQSGKYHELIGQPGPFAELVRRQTA